MARPRNIFEIHRQEGFDEAYSRLWKIFRHELNIGAHQANIHAQRIKSAQQRSHEINADSHSLTTAVRQSRDLFRALVYRNASISHATHSSSAFFSLWEIASGRWIEPFLISSPSRIFTSSDHWFYSR